MISRIAKVNKSFDRMVKSNGGKQRCARKQARIAVDIIYHVTFNRIDGRDEFAPAFISSFCAHDRDTEYVQQNGLLSMWRSYGNEGGFAIVLNTSRLAEMMDEERKRRALSTWFLQDVLYSHETSATIAEIHSDLIDAFEYLSENIIANSRPPNDLVDRLHYPFFSAVATYKHQGFFEEREVRMVYSPLQRGFLTDPGQESLGNREEVSIARTSVGKPYLVFNEGMRQGALPIARIIVGPQRDMLETAKYIERKYKLKRVPITCSETPFIPAGNSGDSPLNPRP